MMILGAYQLLEYNNNSISNISNTSSTANNSHI